MLSVLTEDTLRSAQSAVTQGDFGLFDGEASTIFFEVWSLFCRLWYVGFTTMLQAPQHSIDEHQCTDRAMINA